MNKFLVKVLLGIIQSILYVVGFLLILQVERWLGLGNPFNLVNICVFIGTMGFMRGYERDN